MDEDLAALSREELAAEVTKLRAAIRAHRDSSMHDLNPAVAGVQQI